jgi:hypothetical protein
MSDAAGRSSRRRWRPQFSLLGILMATAIVALSIAAVQLWREQEPLKGEARRLRAETGRLSIDDPGLVYAVAYDRDPILDRSLTWRFYLPANYKYSLRVVAQSVPEVGFLPPDDSIGDSRPLEPGEYVCEASLRKEGGRVWYLRIAVQRVLADGGLGDRIEKKLPLKATANDWLDTPPRAGWSGVTSRTQQPHEPDQPLELLRLRPREFVPKYPAGEEPSLKGLGTERPTRGVTDGALIWIEEER